MKTSQRIAKKILAERGKRKLSNAVTADAKDLENFLLMVKKKLPKALAEIKRGDVGRDTTDLIMRMAKVTDEEFFNEFWG